MKKPRLANELLLVGMRVLPKPHILDLVIVELKFVLVAGTTRFVFSHLDLRMGKY